MHPPCYTIRLPIVDEAENDDAQPKGLAMVEPVELVARSDDDFLLAALVQLSQEQPGLAIGLTLSLPGGTLTGTLIGRDLWFEELTKSVKDSGSVDGEALVSGIVLGMQTMDLSGSEDQDPDAEPEPVRYGFIHLRGVEFSPFRRLPAGEGILWRGRLSEVAGWALGWANAA